MGKHFLLNLYGCSSALLNDEKYLIDLMENAAVASGATVLRTVSHKFDPQGSLLSAYCQKVTLAFILIQSMENAMPTFILVDLLIQKLGVIFLFNN